LFKGGRVASSILQRGEYANSHTNPKEAETRAALQEATSREGVKALSINPWLAKKGKEGGHQAPRLKGAKDQGILPQKLLEVCRYPASML